MATNPYHIPRSQVDVEALAHTLFTYYKLSMVDGIAINKDVSARDAAIKKLEERTNVRFAPTMDPGAVVAYGSDPDPTLARLDAEIAKEPKSIEDHVWRLQCVGTAMLLFIEYKIHLPLLAHQELSVKVMNQAAKRANIFFKQARQSPPSEAGTVSPVSSNRAGPSTAAPAHPTTPPPSSISDSNLKLSDLEIEAYLDSPTKMFNMQFKYLASEDSGLWELHSNLNTREGTEYYITMDGCDGTLPLDRGALRSMLEDSVITRS
ncbi:hypothetical protein BXZ70DRAFT_637212 [Cristinia sonorae]|uniref:Uncharacterized protein n=1 Tax=Cristinia sonorae TaxID=1940300 RepID=A0A8K0XKD3_9AGAR|nr:hypothetical protein BXZ70DRAFT_637212 [Cristinia sonorae]